MKISGLEKVVLALTAAFVLVTVGYFAGVRSTAQPYRVDVEYLQSQETPQVQTGAEANPKPQGVVNINTADARELETLPGIGEKRAEDIVADREANGPFRIPEDLTKVKGIGEAILEGLLDDICVE